MKLIIAEKPNQAKEYADALNDNFERKDGYFQGKNYFITWCFGHLIELERDTAYREGEKWDKSYLPLIPTQFQYCIGKDNKGKEDTGKKKQLNIIKNLMSKSDALINGTDADREGELIFMYVYNYLNCKLPYKRLWVSSLTKEEIRNAFNNLKSSQEVLNLGNSGYARAITDWLVGINATQSATLHLGNGALLSIGRVQTTILKIICERYLKNTSHQKTYKYQLVAEHNYKNIEFESSADIVETENEVNLLLEKVNEDEHLFNKLNSRKERKNPPLLHSIDTLIVESNKRFSLSSKDTLSIAQSLYEKKLTTYPRTDSQYINDEGFVKLKKVIPNLSKTILDLDFSFSAEKPKSVNAEKITGSHDAIVPTGNLDALNKLNQDELNVYKLVLSKCLESFSTPAIYEKKEYIFVNNGIEFNTNSSQLLEVGFLYYTLDSKYRNEIEKTGIDIDFSPNEKVPSKIHIHKIESKPPPLFTDATLTPSLTKIGKFLKEENPQLLEELKGKIDLSEIQVGTQATRPMIIEKLISVGFVEKNKNKFVPTKKGLEFYQAIKDLKVSNVAYTAILEKELNDIANGKLTNEKYYNRLHSFVKLIVSDIFSIESKMTFNERKSFGTCPKCKKGNIVLGKTKKSYGCDQFKQGCDFIFNSTIAHKKLTEKNVKDLLEKGKTDLIKGFKNKKGKKFDAYICLNDKFDTTFDFPDKK